jgi:cobalt-zinc-cadmium efflux system outer membrane protein
MKIRTCTFALALAVAGCIGHAQQSMPDIPGMTMEPQQQQGLQPAARPLPAAPSPVRHAPSITLPFQTMQEPEAPSVHTGSDLQASALLGPVAARETMTLQAFLAMADADHPTLAQAQQSVARSAQLARQAGLPPDPTVGYSGDHIRGGSYHGGEEGAFVAQEFVLGGKLGLRRQVYRAQGHAEELAVGAQRARIHADVSRAFVRALAAQESVVVQDRLLKVALDAETNAHELERIGQDDASDVLTAEIAAEQAQADFENAQRMFLASFTQLATDAGQAALPPHPLTGDLASPPALDTEALVTAATLESPYVQQVQANVAVAEARWRDAKREGLPNLQVKAGAWHSGETLGDTNREAGWMSFAEAGIDLPLWNRNQGNAQAAQIALQQAQEDVTRAQLLIRNRAEPLAQQYQSARSAAERYRAEMLPRARRAYQLEVMKYQQMAQAYPHVLAAQHMLFTLQLAYIRALHQEWDAAFALENGVLTGSLEANGEDTAEAPTSTLPKIPGTGAGE